MKWIFIYFLIINIITFTAFGVDKYKAIRGKWRVSERTLLFLVSLGGFVGGLLGMIVFSHKTIKPSFQIKFYFIVFMRILVMLFLLTRFSLEF